MAGSALGGRVGAYVGRPSYGFYVTDDGRILVLDELADRVLQFASDGRLERVIGRSGQGPGEFRRIGPTVTVVDSFLLVQSYGTRRLSVLTGRFLVSRTYSGHLTSAATKSGLLVSTDSSVLQSSLLQLPAEYRHLPELAMLDIVSGAPVADGLVYGVSAASTLWKATADGAIVDSIPIPVRRRRGFDDGKRGLFVDRLKFDFKAAVEALSDLSGIWSMSASPLGSGSHAVARARGADGIGTGSPGPARIPPRSRPP